MTVNEIPDIFPTDTTYLVLLCSAHSAFCLSSFALFCWPGLAWPGLLNILGNIHYIDTTIKSSTDYNILQNSPLTFPRAGCRTDTVQTLQAGSGLSQYREYREYYVTWEERGEGWWGAPLNSNASLTLVCSLTWSLFVDNQLETQTDPPLTSHLSPP